MNRKHPNQEPQVNRPRNHTPSETIWEEYPVAKENEEVEERGLLLVCAVDECECEQSFDDLQALRDSNWTQLTFPGIPLSNGLTLHESYCPEHSFPELDDEEDDIASVEFQSPDIRMGDGIR